MCCTQLAGNAGLKKSPSAHHRTTLSGCLRSWGIYWQSERNLLNSKKWYLLQMSPQYGELRPCNGWDQLAGLGHQSKFQRVSHLGFVTAVTSFTRGQPNFARCLAISWAGTLYIHFWGLLSPDGILPGANFILHPSLAFSYIGSITARHSTSGRQPNFVAWYKEWNYGIFEDGATYIRLGSHHVGHQPTF